MNKRKQCTHRGERGCLGQGLFGSVDFWVSSSIDKKILFSPNVCNRMTHWCGKFGKKIIIFVKVIQKNVIFRKYFFLFLELTLQFRNFKMFLIFLNLPRSVWKLEALKAFNWTEWILRASVNKVNLIATIAGLPFRLIWLKITPLLVTVVKRRVKLKAPPVKWNYLGYTDNNFDKNYDK